MTSGNCDMTGFSVYWQNYSKKYRNSHNPFHFKDFLRLFFISYKAESIWEKKSRTDEIGF